VPRKPCPPYTHFRSIHPSPAEPLAARGCPTEAGICFRYPWKAPPGLVLSARSPAVLSKTAPGYRDTSREEMHKHTPHLNGNADVDASTGIPLDPHI